MQLQVGWALGHRCRVKTHSRAWVAPIWLQLSLFNAFRRGAKGLPLLGGSKRVVVVVGYHVAVKTH